MATAYAYGLTKNHPFCDGNKRTAAAAAIVFLRLNGWEVTEEFPEEMWALANGTLGKELFSARLSVISRVLHPAFSLVEGRHHSEYVQRVADMIREGGHEQAIALLNKMIDAAEAEAEAYKWTLSPHYYERLAIVYRKERRYQDEAVILWRFMTRRRIRGPDLDRIAARARKANQLASSVPPRWNKPTTGLTPPPPRE